MESTRYNVCQRGLEEGRAYYAKIGYNCIEWAYRDHIIVVMVQNEYNYDMIDEGSIWVFYQDINITDKYIEPMYEGNNRIRPTISNISAIMHLIDANMDDWESDQENPVWN